MKLKTAKFMLLAACVLMAGCLMLCSVTRNMKCVKASALAFQKRVNSCQIVIQPGYDHGMLSVYLPQEWLKQAEAFFNENEPESVN